MNAKLLSLILLGWAVVGCSGSDGTTSPSSAPGVAESAATDTAPPEAGSPEAADTTEPATVAAADLFLPDPAVGLDTLTSYHQELVLTSATTGGGSELDFSNTFASDVWPGNAAFVVFTADDIETGHTESMNGEVGAARYTRSTPEAACAVTWNETAPPMAGRLEPADSLMPVFAATEVGTETIAGTSARHFTFDAAAMGLTGSGELWLAEQGGMLLQYSLDLVGDGVTQTYRYSLTQIDALGNVVLPAGCEPVLDTIPVMDGATSVQRLPGALDYATPAAVADVSAFYQSAMPGIGWVLVGNHATDPQRPTLIFTNEQLLQVASIQIESSDGSTWVSAIVRPWAGTATTTP